MSIHVRSSFIHILIKMKYYVKYLSVVIMNVLLLSNVDGIDTWMFTLHPNSRKCLREEARPNVIVTHEYAVSQIPGQRVFYSVTDSKNQTIVRQESAFKGKGKSSFVSEVFDIIEICFISSVDPSKRGGSVSFILGEPHDVSLIQKHGDEALNALGDARRVKLGSIPLEAALTLFKDLLQSITNVFSYMRTGDE